MAEFAIGARVYRLDRLRLGEIKALARVTAEPIEPSADAMLERCARIVEAGTSRFGAEAFVASEDAECAADELSAAAQIILTLGGFTPGETPAAAKETLPA